MFISLVFLPLLTRHYNPNESYRKRKLSQIVTLCKSTIILYVKVFQTVGSASSSLYLSPSPMSPDPFMCVLDSTLCCS